MRIIPKKYFNNAEEVESIGKTYRRVNIMFIIVIN